MPIEPSPAVGRALDVLELLADRPTEPLTLSELARALGMPRATCHAVVLALVRRGYVVRQADTGRYALGPAGLGLGEAVREGQPWLAALHPVLQEVARRTGLVAAASVRDGPSTVYSAAFGGQGGSALAPTVGESAPFAAPFGAVFAASLPDDEVDAWLGRSGETLSRREEARHRAELRAIGERGYSVALMVDAATEGLRLQHALDQIAVGAGSDEVLDDRDRLVRAFSHAEYLAGDLDPDRSYRVALWSAPVTDAAGSVPLALNLVGPPFALQAHDVAALGEQLRDAATRSGEALRGDGRDGGRPEAPRRRAAPPGPTVPVASTRREPQRSRSKTGNASKSPSNSKRPSRTRP